MLRRTMTSTAFALALAAFAVSPGPTRAAAGDAEAGKKVFDGNCTACHTAASTETNVGPGLKGLFKLKKMPASGKPLTEANVRDKILDGGGGMPGFKDTLSAAQIDDLIAYLKTV
jgi:mono/diheme cytochrome c family protein